MKCTKALFATAVATAMIATMGTCSVWAEDATGTIQGTDTSTGQTSLTYNVTQGYEWTIHSAINFENDKGSATTITKSNNKVSVSKNVIAEGKKLHITVAGSGDNRAFTIQNGTKGKQILNYDVKAGNNNITTEDNTVLDVAAGKDTDSVNMAFTLHTKADGAEVAGEYTGTVTYTAAVVNQ